MSTEASSQSANAIRWRVLRPRELVEQDSLAGLTADARWLPVLSRGLAQQPYCVAAYRNEALVGCLPLAYLKSALFGRFLVSLPYVNSAGPMAESDPIAHGLID